MSGSIVGGLRSRLVHDSFVRMIEDSLRLLGWFEDTIYDDPSGVRAHRRLHFIPRPNEWDEEVEMNSYSVTSDDVTDNPAEMGSALTDDTRVFAVEIYCEDDDIAIHLKDDIRDIIRGKMPSIGRDASILRVFDYRAATPPQIFYCEIENVVSDRANNFRKPWQQHWWLIRCDVIDTFGDELTED